MKRTEEKEGDRRQESESEDKKTNDMFPFPASLMFPNPQAGISKAVAVVTVTAACDGIQSLLSVLFTQEKNSQSLSRAHRMPQQ